MIVNLEGAEEHFADLVAAVDKGEAVEIARPNKPLLVLVPRMGAGGTAGAARPRREFLGTWEAKVAVPTDEEWKAMKKEFHEAAVPRN